MYHFYLHTNFKNAKFLPLHDSQAFPPSETTGSELPLLLPFTTPLLLLSAAGFGLLLQ